MHTFRAFLGGLLVASLLVGCAPRLAVTAATAVQPAFAGLAQATPVPSAPLETGRASWYGPKFAGRPTASGEIFDPSQLTAAHKTLPFGTLVQVTNLENGMTVVVRINDRGPFKPGRVIDVSRAAAERMGMIGSGVVEVRLDLPAAPAASAAPVAAAVASVGTASGYTQQVTLDSTLSGFDVKTAQHPVGQILILSSSLYPQPLRVRVLDVAEGADLRVSLDAFNLLGETVTVQSE